jgi:hypothetical protein
LFGWGLYVAVLATTSLLRNRSLFWRMSLWSWPIVVLVILGCGLLAWLYKILVHLSACA